MTLESRVLEILTRKDASAAEIAREIDVEPEKVAGVLRKLKSAGLLIEV
jgi:Mn-dependent DtxR family transcriptional regulator